MTYTPFLRYCPQKLLTMIFWISILTFTRIHFLTSLWPSLLSYLSAMSLLCLLSLRPPTLSNSRKWTGKIPIAHRPIAEQPKTRIDIHREKQTVQLGRTARSISFCWEREAETRNIHHLRIDGCDTRRDNKPDTNETPQRDRSFSRQRTADITTEKEVRTKPTSRHSLTPGIKGQKRIPYIIWNYINWHSCDELNYTIIFSLELPQLRIISTPQGYITEGTSNREYILRWINSHDTHIIQIPTICQLNIQHLIILIIYHLIDYSTYIATKIYCWYTQSSLTHYRYMIFSSVISTALCVLYIYNFTAMEHIFTIFLL